MSKNETQKGIPKSGYVPSTPSNVIYVHKSWAISELEGKILTFIDASIADPTQRKALKDLLRPMVWQWAIESDMSSYYELKEIQVSSN